MAAYVGVSAPHVDPPSIQIDVTDTQGGCLAPAQSRIGEKEHEYPPRARCRRQAVNLLMSQKHVIAALGTGELEPPSRVGANTTTTNGIIERGGHDKDGLPDGGRTESTHS